MLPFAPATVSTTGPPGLFDALVELLPLPQPPSPAAAPSAAASTSAGTTRSRTTMPAGLKTMLR